MIWDENSLRRTCSKSMRRQAHRLRFLTDRINMLKSIPLIKMIVSRISPVTVKEESRYLKFISLLHLDKKIIQVIAMES